MVDLQKMFTTCHNNSLTKIALFLFGFAGVLIFAPDYDIAFSQTDEEILGSNASNVTTPGAFVTDQNINSSQSSLGFVANGKVNTVISVPNGKWLAAGNWSIILNNGNVTSFETKMTWYNSSGTNAHTHDLTNFRSSAGNPQELPNIATDKQIVIKGVSDVGANGKASWSEVPTTITVNDRKVISISVDDSKTNHHFGGQPLLGIVDSFVECSDLPGPNMELLPPCTVSDVGEQGIPPADGFMPFQGTSPSDNFSQGFPSDDFSQGFPSDDFSQGFPSDDFSQGFPDQGQGFPDQGQGFPDQGQGLPDQGQGLPDQGQGLPSGQFPAEDDQNDETDNADGEESQPEMNPECQELEMENITASSFESDPSDYHPPSDAFDGESSTWWSSNENDPWLQIDLGEIQNICGATVQWNKGDSREYTFEIEVSEDGNDYKKVFEGNNDKGSTEPETYTFEEPTNGQFIRLTTTDTSSGDGWVSVQEFGVLGMSLR